MINFIVKYRLWKKANYTFGYWYEFKRKFWWIRYFIEGVKSIIRWLPTIYKDRDWDDYFLIEILYRKLVHMDKFYNSERTVAKHSSKDLRRLRQARILAERLREDDYLMNALGPHEKKYGSDWDKCFSTPIVVNGVTIGHEMHFVELHEQCKSRNRAYKHSELMRKQDLNMLCSMISKYSARWWD